MSAIGGIFSFDSGAPVSDGTLRQLDRELSRFGPDESQLYVGEQVGFIYRRFSTVANDLVQTQPFRQHGLVACIDGRIDNANELAEELKIRPRNTPVGLGELLLETYRAWGIDGFAKIIGDWAVAIWDSRNHRLLLARDVMGVRPLFYSMREKELAWSSTLEGLVLAYPSLHLDKDYLVGYICDRPPIDSTPYKEIRSVIPGQCVSFSPNRGHQSVRYWELTGTLISPNISESEIDAEFLRVFGRSVERRVQSPYPVLAELSGGLDSSSIVCMADLDRRTHAARTLQTYSYYDPTEPSGDERDYFTLIERRRGIDGIHVEFGSGSLSPEKRTEPLPDTVFSASPGHSQRTLSIAMALNTIYENHGARSVLSGVGGDELLGGVQYEAPEIAYYLGSLRLASLMKCALRWAVRRKKTIYELLWEGLRFSAARIQPRLAFDSNKAPPDWLAIPRETSLQVFTGFTHWHKLPAIPRLHEQIRYNLSSQLSLATPPLVGVVERRYPYLDRDLFEFLASIPRYHVVNSRSRRNLQRRALRGIVPDPILDRKTKWFAERSIQRALAEGNADKAIQSVQRASWLVHLDQFNSAMRNARHGNCTDPMGMLALIGLVQWLESLERHGVSINV